MIIYRIGTHIPVPGFDPDRLAELFTQNQGTYLGLFNMFSGGALERMSYSGSGCNAVYFCVDYYAAAVSDSACVEQLKKEGDSGRRKINQYTRYGTVLLGSDSGNSDGSWLRFSGSGLRSR